MKPADLDLHYFQSKQDISGFSMAKARFNCAVIHMGHNRRKSVSRVSEKVRFKPACTATRTSSKIENLLVTSLDIILPNKQITKALIRLPGCAGWSASLLFANTADSFLA